jgi:hypothetical protein
VRGSNVEEAVAFALGDQIGATLNQAGTIITEERT